ncbi:MAG: hypothetical protein J6K72_06915 [Clostridia bacterium]|nr:hypothetical protein [Clostridia bacterium]
MSKPIKNQFEMIDICRKATSYFVGSFMLEMIKRRNEWQNSATKTRFIESFHIIMVTPGMKGHVMV